jgi:hypothetical protein
LPLEILFEVNFLVVVLQGVWQEGTGDYYVERKQIVLVAGAKM